MMILELAFTDAPERLAARPAHRTLLAELHRQGRLVGAGPWADDSGAMLLFDVTPDELAGIMAADPYYRTAGVEVRSVREWSPVFTPKG